LPNDPAIKSLRKRFEKMVESAKAEVKTELKQDTAQ
jgi:hypothetical protein